MIRKSFWTSGKGKGVALDRVWSYISVNPGLSLRNSAFASAGTVECSLFSHLCSADFRGTKTDRGFHKLCRTWSILGLHSAGPLWGFAHPVIHPWLLRRQRIQRNHRDVSDAGLPDTIFDVCFLFLVQFCSQR